MKTTRKQLANFAIRLIKEVNKTNKDVSIEYFNKYINIWFFNNNRETAEHFDLWINDDLKVNKDKFKKLILRIRGIKL